MAKRHERYGSLMRRIQKIIAGIHTVEKEERAKEKQVNKALLGYDPEKWLKSEVLLRSEDQLNTKYTKLAMPPPIGGKHRFSHCQKLYEEVHSFMMQRDWAILGPCSS